MLLSKYAFLLKDTSLLKFNPIATYYGSATLNAFSWDQSEAMPKNNFMDISLVLNRSPNSSFSATMFNIYVDRFQPSNNYC